MDDQQECPHCGHKGDVDDFVSDSETADAAGVLVCPECGDLIWGDE